MKYKILLIKSETKAPFVRDTTTNELFLALNNELENRFIGKETNSEYCHLYVVSDESIKVGDLVKSIRYEQPFIYGNSLNENQYLNECKKIILHTNPALNTQLIPEAFYQTYIDNRPTEVDISYVDKKLSISLVKKLFTRKDVIDAFTQGYMTGESSQVSECRLDEALENFIKLYL